MKKIILASASPRRREILKNLGFEFEVIVSDADEEKIDKKSIPVNMYVQETALLKATAVLERIKKTDALIISADTVVCCEDKVLGKPKTDDEAREMLTQLSGKCHSVFTGLCVMNAKSAFSVCSATETKVYFKQLTPEKIDNYIKSGEPFDKAGAYAIQGLGGLFAERVEGDFFNVIGLPTGKLCEVLEKEFDFDIFKEQKV